MPFPFDPDRLLDPDYVLGLLCAELIGNGGPVARDIILRVLHERGRALGRKLAYRSGAPSFEHAVRAFVTASARTRTPATLVRLDLQRAEVTGSACPLGLEGRGIEICRTAMVMDQGILEEASGERIRVNVLQSLAAGDQGCRVVFEVEP